MTDESLLPDQPRSPMIDSQPDQESIKWLDGRLDAFNQQQTGRDDFQPLNLVIRDENRLAIAGLKAVTGWDWLYLQVLWVDEQHRGKGFGTQLLQQAEREAADRGCIGACLSSYSFQAPGFYTRNGYSAFGQIDDYPVGSTMFFFSKRF